MIVWRFKYARGPRFGGTQHAYAHLPISIVSICGQVDVQNTVDRVPGYKSLPGPRCKTCKRMAETQQEFQERS